VGEQCGNPPVTGATVCRMHGGSSPAVKTAGQVRRQQELARRELAALGEPEAIDPAVALLQLISWKHGEVKWLRFRVQSLPEEELTWGKAEKQKGIGPQGPVDTTTEKAAPSLWWALLRQAEDQLADYATRALKSGLEERRVRMAEEQGDMVHAVMMAVFNRLQLTPIQWDLVKVAAPEELRRLASD
jgi:hypothetical protein